MGRTNKETMDYLKKHGIRPSIIRIKILDYLLDNRIHPTVDDIYKDLVGEIPTLSKTSVYNTLDLFAKEKIVKVMSLRENELRYDVDTSLHGHFKCERCGRIYDFPVSVDIFTNNALKDFLIRDKSINLYGICKGCNKAN